jgi:retron-type reverse transcriptase
VIGPDVFSFAALWRHYRRCRRHKRRSANALAFELDAEANLLALQSELRARTYQPGRSVCFITEGPKPREVFAADFRDRIVHHLLVAHQERVFEPMFIHDSYACRVGKGTLAASDRLTTYLRQATANGKRPAWSLKLDVASFFPSIHKATLYAIIARRIADPTLLWLTRVRSPKGSKSSGSRKCIRRSVRAGRASRRGFTCRESLAPLHGQPPRCHSGRRTGGV